MHKVIEPKVLYFGTPVILVSTRNADGTSNVAPFSSAWWLGSSCMLGISTGSQTFQNLQRERECVINLPSPDLVSAVDRLALLTGRNPVPDYKRAMGYRYEPDKFASAMLTPEASDMVRPPRVAECPVQMEAVIEQIHLLRDDDPQDSVPQAAIEARIVRVHADERILVPGVANHVDPDRWSPLIMNFCEFYGLSGKLHPSKLAKAFAPSRDLQEAIAK